MPKEFKFILTAEVGGINLIYFIQRSEPKKLLGLLNLFYVDFMYDTRSRYRWKMQYFCDIMKIYCCNSLENIF